MNKHVHDMINLLYYKHWTQYIPYISVTHTVPKSCRNKMATLAHDACDVHGAFSLYIKTCWQSLYTVFLNGGIGEPPPPTKNLLIHPLPTKFLSPPTKSQFNLIKQVIFSCSHCSCTNFILISYSFETDHGNFHFWF